MNVCSFALWKFKTVEGVLKNMRPSEFDMTKYVNGMKSFRIYYDIEKCKARVVAEFGQFEPIVVGFDHLCDELKKLGAYELLPPKECNANALIPFGKNLDI